MHKSSLFRAILYNASSELRNRKVFKMISFLKKHRKYIAAAAALMILSLPALYSSVMPTVTSYLSPAGDAAVPREKPSALRPGDTIGIVAPGTHGGMTDYNQAIHFLEEMGYKVKLAPSVTADYGYLAGSDEERAADINNFFKDDSVKAIVCLRGGYGSARLFSLLDYSMIEKHPKLFVGFSDVTALHAALGEKSHLVTIHGPMLSNFKGENFTPFTLYNFENGLTGSLPTGEIRMPQGTSLKTVVPGKASGRLIGGNLTVVVSLCGTPYELDGKGDILVLEDTGEDPYRIDRLMQQLWQNGLLKRVSAIAFGDFYSPSPKNGEFSTDQVLDYYAKLSGKPVIRGLPIGHGANNLFLPLGVKATIDTKEDGSATLSIDENYLKQ